MRVLVRLKLMSVRSVLKLMHVYSSLRDQVRTYVVIQKYLAGGAIYDYTCLATTAYNMSTSHLKCEMSHFQELCTQQCGVCDWGDTGIYDFISK